VAELETVLQRYELNTAQMEAAVETTERKIKKAPRRGALRAAVSVGARVIWPKRSAARDAGKTGHWRGRDELPSAGPPDRRADSPESYS